MDNFTPVTRAPLGAPVCADARRRGGAIAPFAAVQGSGLSVAVRTVDAPSYAGPVVADRGHSGTAVISGTGITQGTDIAAKLGMTADFGGGPAPRGRPV
jgi:hypothetical protein